MIYCKDCKFYKAEKEPFSASYWSKCTNPDAWEKTINPVSGKRGGENYCDHMRKFTCGREAKFFEPSVTHYAEKEANTFLIAAAPELLAVLEGLLTSGAVCDPGNNPEITEAIRNVMKVVQKAKGETA